MLHLADTCKTCETYFIRTRVSAVKQILAEVDANAKVFGSSIDLCFQTLMIVHQQFNSRNITATSASSHSVTVYNYGSASDSISTTVLFHMYVLTAHNENSM